MHSLDTLAADIAALLKTTGGDGDTGDKSKKVLQQSKKCVPIEETLLSPNESERGHLVNGSGTKVVAVSQPFREIVPTAPSVPIEIRWTLAHVFSSTTPAEWSAIFAELNTSNPPDDWSHDRWREIISDAENFLNRWGAAAHQLGWTALDLFGVHPTRPAARFDMMGLALFIQGGAVVALTDAAATIRRQSGAVLTYRRSDISGAATIDRLARHE